MNHRHQKWEQTVNRNSDGLLDFAQARTWGEGDNALLLVHGFGDGPYVWKTLGPALADKGYTVRVMRLPGWNETIETKRTITLSDWESAVQSELLELKNTHKHVAVLAHSLGGCVTTVLAQDQELSADALVLYAPMLEVSSARSPILKTSTWFKIGNTLLPDSIIIESMFADHARVNPPRPKTERDPFNPKNIFEMIYTEMDRFENQAPRVTLPLRLVLPGEDRVINNQRSQLWFEDLVAPQKDLFIDEAAGHVLPLDVDVLAESDRLVLWLTEQGIAP